MAKKIKARDKKLAYKFLTNEMNEFKQMTLSMITQAALNGELAYMDGRDPNTGEIVPLLVGLESNDKGSFSIYPLARFYMDKNIPEFETPDGRGNYITAKGPPATAGDETESRTSERIN